jgi:hypothetical protein
MPRILIAAATAATGLALLTGCDFGTKTAPAKPVTATAPAAPGSAQATGGAASGKGPTRNFPNAKAAADALVAAWNIGDKNAALLAAGPNTVEKVFSSVVNTDAKIQACDPGSQSGVSYAYDCYYRYDGGSTHFYVNAYAPSGWRVVDYKQVLG